MFLKKNEKDEFTKKLDLFDVYKDNIDRLLEKSKYLNPIELASSIKFVESILYDIKGYSLLDEFVKNYTYTFEIKESTINNKHIFLGDSLSEVGELVYEILIMFNVKIKKENSKIVCEVDTLSYKDYDFDVNNYINFLKEIFG